MSAVVGKRALSSSALLVSIAAIIVIAAALREASSVLIPFMMALLLAVVSSPPLAWLERKRVPEPVAAALMLCANIAVFGAGAIVVASSAADFGDAVPKYRARFGELSQGAFVWLAQHRIHVPQSALGQILSPGNVLSVGADMVQELASLVSDMLIVLLILGFMLFESRSFSRKMDVLTGQDGGVPGRFGAIAKDVQKYLFIKTIVSLAMGVVLGVFVGILGLDFPVLWGLVSFLLNFVPNVGGFIAAVPPVMLALITHGPGRALVVALGFIVVHMVIGNIIEPAWMGRRLGLSATVVFLSLLFWGFLWGPGGMFLSVPLTMVARILLEGSEKTRWMAVLLDSNVPSEDPTSGVNSLRPSEKAKSDE